MRGGGGVGRGGGGVFAMAAFQQGASGGSGGNGGSGGGGGGAVFGVDCGSDCGSAATHWGCRGGGSHT